MADFGGMVNRSRGVADGMSKGVTFLMKGIDVIMGDGKLLPGKKLKCRPPTAPSPSSKPTTSSLRQERVRDSPPCPRTAKRSSATAT